MPAGLEDGVGRIRLSILTDTLGTRTPPSLQFEQVGEHSSIELVGLCVVVIVTPDTLHPVTGGKQVVEHDRLVELVLWDSQKTEQSDAIVARLHGWEVDDGKLLIDGVVGLSLVLDCCSPSSSSSDRSIPALSSRPLGAQNGHMHGGP